MPSSGVDECVPLPYTDGQGLEKAKHSTCSGTYSSVLGRNSVLTLDNIREKDPVEEAIVNHGLGTEGFLFNWLEDADKRARPGFPDSLHHSCRPNKLATRMSWPPAYITRFV
jgi:hypothetical protein